MSQIVDVVAVEVVRDFVLRVRFSDGTVGTVDLGPWLVGPVFGPLREEPELFRAARVDPQLGTVVWPNGADVAPETLHRAVLGASAS